MNIRLDQTTIRIRITQAEFYQLKKTGSIKFDFVYLPLLVSIVVHPLAKIGAILPKQINLSLVESELNLLLTPEIKKSGLKLMVLSVDNHEIAVDLQVDLHE
ncbi:MAG: hypothetical protein QG673_2010 [Pseudomonadota bacterium]|nr:hypothetical protein [Pseudomonadota bacterium]